MPFKTKIGAFFFIITILLSVIGSVFIQVNFLLNKDYIVKELCVQKEVEKNTCQGKCHLSKQLKVVDNSSDDNERKQNEKLQEINISALVSHVVTSDQYDFVLTCRVDKVVYENDFKTLKGYPYSHLRPPLV